MALEASVVQLLGPESDNGWVTDDWDRGRERGVGYNPLLLVLGAFLTSRIAQLRS